MKEQLEVTDLKGNKIGVMNVRNNTYSFIEDYTGIIQQSKCSEFRILFSENEHSFFEFDRLRLHRAIQKEKSTLKLMICLLMHQMSWWEKKSILFSKSSIAEEYQTNIR